MDEQELTEDFEILIDAWLKSTNDDTITISRSLSKYVFNNYVQIND